MQVLKIATLSDGRDVIIGVPSIEEDLERLQDFYSGLPQTAKAYYPDEASRIDYVNSRLAQLDGEKHFRLIAELEGEVVADGTLDRVPGSDPVGQMRTVVVPWHQHKGIGTLITSELVILGADVGLKQLIAEVPAEHLVAVAHLKRLGFETKGPAARSFEDGDGVRHEMIVMADDLEDVWQHLVDFLEEMDLRARSFSGF